MWEVVMVKTVSNIFFMCIHSFGSCAVKWNIEFNLSWESTFQDVGVPRPAFHASACECASLSTCSEMKIYTVHSYIMKISELQLIYIYII